MRKKIISFILCFCFIVPLALTLIACTGGEGEKYNYVGRSVKLDLESTVMEFYNEESKEYFLNRYDRDEDEFFEYKKESIGFNYISFSKDEKQLVLTKEDENGRRAILVGETYNPTYELKRIGESEATKKEYIMTHGNSYRFRATEDGIVYEMNENGNNSSEIGVTVTFLFKDCGDEMEGLSYKETETQNNNTLIFNYNNKDKNFTLQRLDPAWNTKESELVVPATFMDLPVVGISDDIITTISAGNRRNLTKIKLPDSIKTICDEAFKNGWYLQEISLGKGIISIGTAAFENCNSIQSIVLPASVTSIKADAFTSCNINMNIFVEAAEAKAGFESGWNGDCANIYYLSEAEPTNDGNFWHYVEGVPTIWA